MRKLILVAVVLYIASWSSYALSEVSLAGHDNPIIRYQGSITFEQNAAAFKLYENAATKPSTLEITSLGGGINAGLELGEWIAEKNLNVSIPKYCVSSCANYIFTAGHTKFIGQHAYLIWHGGAYQPGLASLLKSNANRSVAESVNVSQRFATRQQKHQEIDNYIASIQKREDIFFDSIGINSNITILGQIFPYRSQYPSDKGFSGWDYSMLDLAKLGVKNVLVENNHWMPNTGNASIRIHRLVLE